jgi:hypothetical protein
MAGQLREQERTDHPTDATGIGLMVSGEILSPPAGEIRVGAEQDQPGNGGHGDIDAGEAQLDRLRLQHKGNEAGFPFCTSRLGVKP